MVKDNIPKYIVVFDMDETLGHFEQLSIFWMTLVNYLNKKSIKIKKELLFEIIDNHFNKILRPKIIDILKYLQLQKKNNICDKIIIFTNNTSRKWSNLISDYFHAWHDGVFWSNITSIPIFRLMQFWGTYQGFRQQGKINNQLKETFYYPRRLSRQDDQSQLDKNRPIIDYSNTSQTLEKKLHA